MREITLPLIGTVAAWRREVRVLAAEGVAADQVLWQVGEERRDLFTGHAMGGEGRSLKVPRAALDEIGTALHHNDPERFSRAHALVLRLSDGLVWGDRTDDATCRVLEQAKTVRREVHKMHAFVRFREVQRTTARRCFAAWFEPEHPVTEIAVPFFARRFGDMDWVIATPSMTARFDGAVSFHETVDASPPPEDATEELWKTYYASIFNPARVMAKAMQSEMPKKYWKNLPEAALIPDLIRGAEARVSEMQAREAAEAPARRLAVARTMAVREVAAPEVGSMDELRQKAAACTRCPLHCHATQTVMGEGPSDSPLMIVGEQPGDHEDLAGRPFVGPAGQLFDQVAGIVGLDRQTAYVTNAVKHFKFAPRGKRRLHQRPVTTEINACNIWLDAELALVKPKLILSMGATALQALTGSGDGILKRRGQIEPGPNGVPVLVTVHPSFILRLPEDRQGEERDRFRAELAWAARML